MVDMDSVLRKGLVNPERRAIYAMRSYLTWLTIFSSLASVSLGGLCRLLVFGIGEANDTTVQKWATGGGAGQGEAITTDTPEMAKPPQRIMTTLHG